MCSSDAERTGKA